MAEKKMRFVVLQGKHSQKEEQLDADGNPRKDKDGNVIRAPVTYARGSIVESNIDLAARFNAGPNSQKFQKLDDEDPRGKRGRRKSRDEDESEPEYAPNPEQAAAVAPGGQVSSGKQATVGGPGVGQISGPLQTADALRKQAEELPDLDHMTVEQLREYAEDEEIDLKGLHRKDEMVKAVRTHSAKAKESGKDKK